MKVKVTYTYARRETIDVDMPDGITPKEIQRLAMIEAEADAPAGSVLQRVSWLTSARPRRFGSNL